MGNMQDQVICPYCPEGVEMKKSALPYGPVKWSYYCPVCGSASPLADTEKEAKRLAFRHYQPENRVLTLDEVKEICEEGLVTHLWIEHKDTVFRLSCWRETDFLRDKRLKMQEFVEEYGNELRCWLRKPTDEERKAVPWE